MKNEKGAITLLTLGTVIFMMAFLLSSFVIISNRMQSQVEMKKEIAKLYAKDLGNEENIYKEYFASSTDEVPITNAEQLLKIGTGKEIAVAGKIYKCDKNKNYVLKRNIEVDAEAYANKAEYSNMFKKVSVSDTMVNTWIGKTDLTSKGLLTGTFTGGNYAIQVITTKKIITYDKNNSFSI